jgi:hypothetical protein
MLKAGSTILSIWSTINFLLAALILTSVVIFNANSPLLVMVFEKSEIASLDARVIASLNALTILYNSCSVALSVLVWLLIRKSLIAGQKWGFWALLFVIGFVEVMAFIASAPIGNSRWQVNVLQSILYVVGISLCAYPILNPKTEGMINQQNKDVVLT